LRVDPTTGLHVSVGTFEVDRTAASIEAVQLTVSLGTILNHQPPSLSPSAPFLTSPPSRADLKPGYHSLCVSPSRGYVVFNNAQVKAVRLVRFAGGANLSDGSVFDDICDSCQTRQATVWCVNDSAKYCEACDAEAHAVNRIMKRHRRIPLREARAVTEFCPFHTENRIEYYCPQCQLPVCVDCKMTGGHSRGAAASHALVSVRDAYARALEASEHADPVLVRRKAAITARLQSASASLGEVLANADAVEAEIRRIADGASRQARLLAGEKALAVRSVTTELERKLAELDAIERSLAAQRRAAAPLEFLRAADRAAALLAALHGAGDLPREPAVHGDLAVYGDLGVGATRGAALPPGAAAEDALDQSAIREPPSTPLLRRTDEGHLVTSMALVARRREQRNRGRGLELAFSPFQGSRIVPSPDEAVMLYHCFPFKAQPLTHLLFASARDGRSVRKLHELVDGIGITAVIVQAGHFKFGGFAASKWNSSGRPFGDGGSSFLFSLTGDALIPYKGEAVDSCQLFASEESIAFGRRDLVLQGNLDRCSSVIENAYGIGLPEGSKEAHTFLAGTDTFTADQVEVWGFFTIEQE
jgi:hypothetical protein